jgi:hypothetical protein
VTKRERARAAWAMVKVMRVAGDEEGEDGKAMAMATRMAGKWGCLTRDANEGNGNKGGRQATALRVMVTVMALVKATVMTWAISTAMRLAGDKEGKGKGGKDNGEGDEGGR